MSKARPASDMLARFRKTAEQPKPVAVVVPEVEPETASEASAPKPRMVRITLDLEAPQHKFLKRLALEEELSVADLLRAVVGWMEEDPQVAQAIAARARQLGR
ncbi:MAG: hypothetical protein KatS3mg071_1888 [Meiothermus sp.]|nr:MAG: hypothetical protein KatS3mg071_1888 [Meiothermus sp.]